MPTKLQSVGQYMYAGAEEDQGIRTNSRYFRAGDNGGCSVIALWLGHERIETTQIYLHAALK